MSGTGEHVSLGDLAAGMAGVSGSHRLVGSVVGERADGDVYETLRAAALEVIRERQLAPDDHRRYGR